MEQGLKYNPELQIEPADRAHLISIVSMPGFKILQRIFRSEVDKFVLAQINADPAKPEEVLSAHRMAKAAAQFYQGVMNAINEELTLFAHTPKPGDKPVDATEGLIDLGEDGNLALGGE